MKNTRTRLTAWMRSHKLASTGIILIVVIGGIGIARAAGSGTGTPQYVVSPVVIGSIVQTVSGSGQVSAANQIDVTSQASGAITSIAVNVGDHVTAGQLLATIDDTNAKNTLTSAQLSYAQVVEPPKAGDLRNAQNSLSKSYSDGQNSLRNAYVDLQTVMTGANALLYGQNGFLSAELSVTLTPTGQGYRDQAGTLFDIAKTNYQTALADYSSLTPQSASSTVRQAVSETYSMLQKVGDALQSLQGAIAYISTNEPQYHPNLATTATSNIASWLSLVNGDLSSVGSAGSSIDSSENSLATLVQGADPLQVQSAELNLRQAEQTYGNYFVRAPFDGIVGRIPVSLYQQAGGSTIVATIVGDQKIANISLDEVDAAKVHAGDAVTITFDAITGFTATGTVSSVDLVGTVSGGVVSYGVKISIGTEDDRIRPGMSLNVTITTMRTDGVLVVPTSAVKTQGGRSYVQVLPQSVVTSYMQSARQAASSGASSGTNGTVSQASGTPQRQFGGSYGGGQYGSSTPQIGSTTSPLASSTRAFGSGAATTARRSISLTIPSSVAPQNITVVTSDADDTDTEIVSGLSQGQWVVTRTVASGSAAAATAAPSILSTLGGGARTGAAGAGGATFRAGTAVGR